MKDSTTTKVIFLVNKMPRYGRASGYEQIASYVCKLSPGTKLIRPEKNLFKRIIGKAFSLYRGLPAGDQTNAAAELSLSLAMGFAPKAIAHILYVEYHLPFIDTLPKPPKHLLATIHEPKSRWQSGQLIGTPNSLKRLSAAIVMYDRDREYFESIIGQGKVHLILHGVDSEFFRPAQIDPQSPVHILYVGVHLRNTAMLHRVIVRMAKDNPALRFDLVVVKEALHDPELQALLNHPSVIWHHSVSDTDLRSLYQKSYLSLLPMNDSGANNTVVEALASGLPLVTTDCGGIRDYGGGTIFPIVENNDDQAMIDLVNKYIGSPGWRNAISSKCREFAIENLAWPVIAEKHLELYRTLSRLRT